jgi:hypothetical protein
LYAAEPHPGQVMSGEEGVMESPFEKYDEIVRK